MSCFSFPFEFFENVSYPLYMVATKHYHKTYHRKDRAGEQRYRIEIELQEQFLDRTKNEHYTKNVPFVQLYISDNRDGTARWILNYQKGWMQRHVFRTRLEEHLRHQIENLQRLYFAVRR